MSTSAQPNSRQRLTVAMIARDAESVIADTLNSIRPIADEIIVVDTGSMDNTRQIATSLATKVVDWQWTDDFSAARNIGMSHATGDWVFWIDAGETMAQADAVRLRQFVDQQASPASIYMMLVKQPPEPGQTAGEQVGRFRLMPRRDDLSFEGRLRETVAHSAAAAGLQFDAIDPRIQRSANDLDENVRRAKAVRDVRIADLEINTSPTMCQAHLAKGEAMVGLSDMATARTCFQTARQLSVAGSGEMLESYYGELTTYNESDPAERDAQLALCLEALEHCPTDTQLLCAMGSYLQGQGRMDLANRAYLTATMHGQVRPEIWHLGDISDVALVCLSLTYQLQDQDAQAREALEKALAEGATSSDRVRRQLIEICIKMNDRQAALAQVDQLSTAAQSGDTLRTAIRGACLAAQGNWISAKAYLETAFNAGCRDTLCFRGLIKAMVSLHETAEAQQMLQQWRECDPHNPEIELLSQSLGGETSSAAGQPLATSAASFNLRVDRPGDDQGASHPHQASVGQPSITRPSV